MGNVSSGFYNSSNCASINFKGNHLVIDYRLVLALTNASLMSATPPLLNQIRRTNDRLAQISKKKREEKKTSLLAKFVHAVLRFEKIRENSFWKQIRTFEGGGGKNETRNWYSPGEAWNIPPPGRSHYSRGTRLGNRNGRANNRVGGR